MASFDFALGNLHFETGSGPSSTEVRDLYLSYWNYTGPNTNQAKADFIRNKGVEFYRLVYITASAEAARQAASTVANGITLS
jgi:hypothetical protein